MSVFFSLLFLFFSCFLKRVSPAAVSPPDRILCFCLNFLREASDSIWCWRREGDGREDEDGGKANWSSVKGSVDGREIV